MSAEMLNALAEPALLIPRSLDLDYIYRGPVTSLFNWGNGFLALVFAIISNRVLLKTRHDRVFLKTFLAFLTTLPASRYYHFVADNTLAKKDAVDNFLSITSNLSALALTVLYTVDRWHPFNATLYIFIFVASLIRTIRYRSSGDKLGWFARIAYISPVISISTKLAVPQALRLILVYVMTALNLIPACAIGLAQAPLAQAPLARKLGQLKQLIKADTQAQEKERLKLWEDAVAIRHEYNKQNAARIGNSIWVKFWLKGIKKIHHTDLWQDEIFLKLSELKIMLSSTVLGMGGMGIALFSYKDGHECVTKLYLDNKVANQTRRVKKQPSERDLEYQTLKKVDCEYIIKAIEFHQVKEVNILVLEYVNGVTLSSCVNRITKSNMKTILAKIAIGIQAFHDAGILHRDLNHNNIIIDFDEINVKGKGIKIIDTGLSNFLDRDLDTPFGQLHFSKIEQLSGLEKHSPTNDWYSLGILLYYMHTKNLPPLTVAQPPRQTFLILVDYQKMVNRVNRISNKQVKDIITRLCFTPGFSKIDSLDKLQNSDLMAGFDWKTV